jgi:hypothetical protein
MPGVAAKNRTLVQVSSSVAPSVEKGNQEARTRVALRGPGCAYITKAPTARNLYNQSLRGSDGHQKGRVRVRR